MFLEKSRTSVDFGFWFVQDDIFDLCRIEAKLFQPIDYQLFNGEVPAGVDQNNSLPCCHRPHIHVVLWRAANIINIVKNFHWLGIPRRPWRYFSLGPRLDWGRFKGPWKSRLRRTKLGLLAEIKDDRKVLSRFIGGSFGCSHMSLRFSNLSTDCDPVSQEQNDAEHGCKIARHNPPPPAQDLFARTPNCHCRQPRNERKVAGILPFTEPCLQRRRSSPINLFKHCLYNETGQCGH